MEEVIRVVMGEERSQIGPYNSHRLRIWGPTPAAQTTVP